MRFGEHDVITTVGVEFSENSERNGKKHVLGLQARVTENTSAVRSLLHLREHELDTKKRYLFVIDGAKELLAGIWRFSLPQGVLNSAATAYCANGLGMIAEHDIQFVYTVNPLDTQTLVK